MDEEGRRTAQGDVEGRLHDATQPAPDPATQPAPDPATQPAPVAWDPPATMAPARDAIPGWGAPVAWETPDPAARRGTFDVGAVFGGMLSMYARWWPLYAALALPTAIIGMVVGQIGVEAIQRSSVLLLSLINLPLTIFITLAMIVVTDDARSGTKPDLASALRRAAGRFLHAAGAAMLGFLAIAALVAVPSAIAAVSPLVGGILLLVVFAGVFYLFGRWALIFPAIVLDELGPVDGLRRSWHVTKRNLWRFVALFIFIGILTAPLSIAIGLLAFAGEGTWVPLTGLATILTTPLMPIALALAHADVTDRPPERTPVRPGRGRAVAAAAIVGLGVVLLVPAGLTVGTNFQRIISEGMTAAIPPEERGQLVAGLDRGPGDSCRPERLSAVVGADETIYLGGYLERVIFPGEPAVIDVYIDDELAFSDPLEFSTAVGCYFEGPVADLAPARYRFVIRIVDETLAEGFLTIVE